MPTQALRGNVQKIQASDTYETHGNTGEGDTRMTENTQPKKTVTRRQVLAMAGCGVGGLVVGGVLAKWGVVEDSVASGRIAIETTPTKMIVTDRARCSGCQRCEMMCTLKNDGRVCQNIARVRVWENYYWGTNPGSGDGRRERQLPVHRRTLQAVQGR